MAMENSEATGGGKLRRDAAADELNGDCCGPDSLEQSEAAEPVEVHRESSREEGGGGNQAAEQADNSGDA